MFMFILCKYTKQVIFNFQNLDYFIHIQAHPLRGKLRNPWNNIKVRVYLDPNQQSEMEKKKQL